MAVSRLDSGGLHIRAVNAAKSVGRLARVDSILSRMATISHGDELAPSMLERVLNADPVLSQKVPNAIAAYCGETKQPMPGSICDAVRGFGYASVRDLVLIVGIAEVHRELAARCELSAEQLTSQAIAVAAAAEYLGKKNGQPQHLSFTSGLFANIGVATLASCERGYQSIAASVAGGQVRLHEAELHALGCTHADTSYCLLTDYAFEEWVAACAATHCSESNSSLACCIHIAESFAHQLGFDGGFAIVPPKFNEELFAKLGGTSTDAENIVVQITKWSSLSSKLLA